MSSAAARFCGGTIGGTEGRAVGGINHASLRMERCQWWGLRGEIGGGDDVGWIDGGLMGFEGDYGWGYVGLGVMGVPLITPADMSCSFHHVSFFGLKLFQKFQNSNRRSNQPVLIPRNNIMTIVWSYESSVSTSANTITTGMLQMNKPSIICKSENTSSDTLGKITSFSNTTSRKQLLTHNFVIYNYLKTFECTILLQQLSFRQHTFPLPPTAPHKTQSL